MSFFDNVLNGLVNTTSGKGSGIAQLASQYWWLIAVAGVGVVVLLLLKG